jgi:uncharacterized membrane protein YfcA
MSDKAFIDRKRPRVSHDVWISAALIMVCCLFLGASVGLGNSARTTPQTVLLITLALLVLQLLRAVIQRAPTIVDVTDQQQPVPLPAPMAIGWIVAAITSVWLVGVSAGIAVFSLLYMRWYAREHWRVSLAFALGLGLGVQLLFGTLLQASLYPGLLLSLH